MIMIWSSVKEAVPTMIHGPLHFIRKHFVRKKMELSPFMHVEPSLLQLNLLILVITCSGSSFWHVTNNKHGRVGSNVSFLGFGLDFGFGLDA